MHATQLKHRAIVHYEHFLRSLRKVSKIYGVGKSTLARWVKQATGGSRAKLHNSIEAVVQQTVSSRPFTTADGIIRSVREALGKEVSRSTVYRSLKALRHSYKRASRGREHEPVPIDHPFLVSDSSQGDPIAVDESSFYWNDYPRMGWGPKGKRVAKARPRDRKRVSLLLAVGKEGVVGYAVLSGGVKSQHFADFVRSLPNNRPLILDNCSIHKTRKVRELCRSKGQDMRFIPPYCPWYNPVEFCFSEIKRAYRPIRLEHPSVDFVDDVVACLGRLRYHDRYFDHAQTACLRDRAVVQV